MKKKGGEGRETDRESEKERENTSKCLFRTNLKILLIYNIISVSLKYL